MSTSTQATTTTPLPIPARQPQPQSISEYDTRQTSEWMYSFAATMVPFTGLCYLHSRGVTIRVVESMLKSPFGGYGLLALPFCTLMMEKSVYDTVQAYQGIDPNVRPTDRGGFPSGGACKLNRITHTVLEDECALRRNEKMALMFVFLFAALPSFSLIPVQKPSSKDLM